MSERGVFDFVNARVVRVVCVFFIAIFFVFPLLAAQSPSDDGTRYFLTRLGLIQEGIPEDRGETVFLRLPGGGGLTISKLDILFVGLTRSELFEYQRRLLPEGDTSALLKLADWAGRNRLATEAIAYLKETAQTTADSASRATILQHIAKMEYVERIKNEAARQMSESEKNLSAISLPGAATMVDPERARLSEFSKGIPYTVEEKFIRRVEPILLRRCGGSDCHQEETGATFTLAHPETASSFRTAHLRNLESVLDFVSCARPETSPILNHPKILGNNGEQVWPFGADEKSLKDYETFVEWITSLNGKLANYIPDPNRPRPAGRERIVKPMEPERETTNEIPLMANIPIDSTKEYKRVDPNDNDEALRRAGYHPKTVLRDEFDPAPFNQKYHPNGPNGGLQQKPF